MTTILTPVDDAAHLGSASRWSVAGNLGTGLVPLSSSARLFWTYLTTTTPAAFDAAVQPTASGVGTTASSTSSTRMVAERVGRLRELSGLTTSQISRLMNVSRRSIHYWLSGGPMSSGNEERLTHLLDVVASIPGNSTQKRAALLDSKAGHSLFHQLLDEVAKPAAIHVDPLTPRDRIDT